MDPSSLSPASAAIDIKDGRDESSSSLNSLSSSASSSNKNASNGSNKPQAPPLHRTSSGSSITGNSRRQSLVESLRGGPTTGHRSRQPSLTPAAVQDLLNNPPPPGKNANPKFAGREWRDIGVGELVSAEDVIWADLDTTVEEATKLLVKSPRNVVLVREDAQAKKPVSTFDFSDLNAYLLVVVGLAKPGDGQLPLFNHIISVAQKGGNVLLREIQELCRKETLVNISTDSKLAQAIEILGGGIHRVVVADADGDIVGILSQLKVVDFFWNERATFPAVDRLYAAILRDLGIGTQQILSVNSDAPLSEALILMNDEGLTSVAVVDNGQNVVGNISAKDIRHLTSTSSAPLLKQSCMHFISVILNERGMERGRDAVPVFYVNPNSTLAHTVAKLTATRSHRMWVVESASPSPSAPATPMLGPQSASAIASGSGSGSSSGDRGSSSGDRGSAPGSSSAPAPGGQSTSPLPPTPTSPVPPSPVPASAMAGARMSGKLTGVISLTDILNVFAKFTGLHPLDPGEQRARRRRSSSSSVRPSIDSSTRPSIDSRR